MPAMTRRAALVIGLAILAFAGVTTWVTASSGAGIRFLAFDLIGGLTFLGAGLAAVWLRPASPAGPALMTCGALWFVGSYGPSGQPIVMHLGFAFEGYYDLVLAGLLLLVTGGLRGFPRLTVGLLAISMAARSFGRLVFVDPAALGCAECPPNPFALWPSVDAFLATDTWTNVSIAALAILIGLIAVRRLGGQSPVARRARGPILVAGTLAMAATTYDAADYAWANSTGESLVSLPDPASEAFAWALFGLRLLVPIGFLMATLRVRGQAGPLAPLAAELGRPGGGTIEEALRRALGDPSVELLRPTAAGGWEFSGGTPAALPTSPARSVTRIGPQGAPVAALVHEPALLDQPELLDGVVRVLGLALENERLGAEVRSQLQEVTESRVRIVEAAEAERRRVERDLHDGAQQRLIGAMLAIQQARASADAGDAAGTDARALRGDVAARLDAAAEELNGAVRDLRELARGIHPAILAEEGLGAAVAGLARRAGLPVEVDVDLDGRLPALVESTAYFTIAEALTNAQRHAGASQASVHVTRGPAAIVLEVRDNGAGGADPGRGSGLRGLGDRVTAVGGRLDVESPKGGGTTIRAWIPVPVP